MAGGIPLAVFGINIQSLHSRLLSQLRLRRLVPYAGRRTDMGPQSLGFGWTSHACTRAFAAHARDARLGGLRRPAEAFNKTPGVLFRMSIYHSLIYIPSMVWLCLCVTVDTRLLSCAAGAAMIAGLLQRLGPSFRVTRPTRPGFH